MACPPRETSFVNTLKILRCRLPEAPRNRVSLAQWYALLVAIPTDADGCPRQQDGDGNSIAVVDMGAFERPAIAADVGVSTPRGRRNSSSRRSLSMAAPKEPGNASRFRLAHPTIAATQAAATSKVRTRAPWEPHVRDVGRAGSAS